MNPQGANHPQDPVDLIFLDGANGNSDTHEIVMFFIPRAIQAEYWLKELKRDSEQTDLLEGDMSLTDSDFEALNRINAHISRRIQFPHARCERTDKLYHDLLGEKKRLVHVMLIRVVENGTALPHADDKLGGLQDLVQKLGREEMFKRGEYDGLVRRYGRHLNV